MRSNAQLKLLESSSARVGAANWYLGVVKKLGETFKVMESFECEGCRGPWVVKFHVILWMCDIFLLMFQVYVNFH